MDAVGPGEVGDIPFRHRDDRLEMLDGSAHPRALRIVRHAVIGIGEDLETRAVGGFQHLRQQLHRRVVVEVIGEIADAQPPVGSGSRARCDNRLLGPRQDPRALLRGEAVERRIVAHRHDDEGRKARARNGLGQGLQRGGHLLRKVHFRDMGRRMGNGRQQGEMVRQPLAHDGAEVENLLVGADLEEQVDKTGQNIEAHATRRGERRLRLHSAHFVFLGDQRHDLEQRRPAVVRHSAENRIRLGDRLVRPAVLQGLTEIVEMHHGADLLEPLAEGERLLVDDAGAPEHGAKR